MVGVVRPSLSWCYLLRKIALSRVGGVVWPTWANLSSIPRLITILQPKFMRHFRSSGLNMMHLIMNMDLVLISLVEIYFSLIINSRTHFPPPVLSFVGSRLDILLA